MLRFVEPDTRLLLLVITIVLYFDILPSVEKKTLEPAAEPTDVMEILKIHYQNLNSAYLHYFLVIFMMNITAVQQHTDTF